METEEARAAGKGYEFDHVHISSLGGKVYRESKIRGVELPGICSYRVVCSSSRSDTAYCVLLGTERDWSGGRNGVGLCIALLRLGSYGSLLIDL